MNTKDFLDALHGPDAHVTFRVIKEDTKASRYAKAEYMPYSEYFIKGHNDRGYGIFFLPNATGSSSTKDEDVQSCHAVFIDVDDDDLPGFFPLAPSAIISREDKLGHHVYWFLHPTDDIEDWRRVQTQLIAFYGSDGAIKNPARIMRLPGTVNCKPKRNGQKYLIEKLVPENRYDLNDVRNAHADREQLLKGIRKFIAALVSDPTKDFTDRGTVNDIMVKIVMRMNGLSMTDEDMFAELSRVNKSKFNSIFTDDDIRRRITAKKYAKSPRGRELALDIEAKLAKQAAVKEALTDWWYVQQGNFFLHEHSHDIERNKEGFNAAFAEISGLNNTANFAFLHGLIKQAEKIVYEPGLERITPGPLTLPNINIWKDDRVKPDETDYTWFIDHLIYLLPDERERDHFLNFLAYLVQNPGAKIMHAVLIIGKQGIGKSILNDLFASLFGPSNVSMPHNENLADKYTKWARNCCLCIINELKQEDKTTFYPLVKPYITEPKIEIREMYKDPYTVTNHINIIAYSNEEIPIKLENNDRRWAIFKSPVDPKGPAYYKKLAKQVKDNAGGVMTYLMSRDVKGFNPGELPEMTKAKQFIMDDSKTEIELCLQDWNELKNFPLDKDLVCVNDVVQALMNEGRFGNRVSSKYVAKVLRGFGAIPMENPIKILTDVKRFYILRNHEYWKDVEKQEKGFKIVQKLFNDDYFDDFNDDEKEAKGDIIE